MQSSEHSRAFSLSARTRHKSCSRPMSSLLLGRDLVSILMTVGSSKNIQITYLLLGNHSLQAFNILMGVLVLAKSCSEHHHHEVSAKKRIPGKCDILCSSFYYLAHVPFRTISYALLFAHYRYFASTFIVVQVRDNWSCR